ncbi:MAG: STAS domain-containing protein [SAR324 cluster bacterium]|nr:STAS domain-containing protein [SAR324 cluster bacterium]
MSLVQSRLENNICLINLEGEVNQKSIEQIIAIADEMRKEIELRGVIINFKEMNYIDSIGIGMLMQLFKDFQSWQVKLAFCHLSDSLCEYFSMSFIDTVISIHSTEEEALASFA